ncbi:MAG: helix-hairpin-helix domain-containing protein [Ferruginibacter sp.]
MNLPAGLKNLRSILINSIAQDVLKYEMKYFTKIIFVCCFLFILMMGDRCIAQTIDPAAALEEQVENISMANQDEQPEDDSFLQELQEYLLHPLNLNTANEEELEDLKILSPLEIRNILNYRNLLGKFIDVYELQAVPGLDISTARKLRPYITVSESQDLFSALGKRFKAGNYNVLLRIGQVPELSKGYRQDTVANHYEGSPQKILLRYRFVYKNLLSFGILGEKDAGEQFLRGNQKKGFDFYSIHFFAANIGIIKALALGDFSVSMGQGLIQWQSFAFKKGADVLNIKRQSSVLHPYSSAGENNFHRGAGITLEKGKWQTSLFGSYRKLDANFLNDSSGINDGYVSSLQTSGYHRTANEIADKGTQHQLSFGGNIIFRKKQWHIGINVVVHQFKLPVIKAADPYNLFALSGKKLSDYSIDYSYTFKNMHLFGEAAIDNQFHRAMIAGMLVSVSGNTDLSFVYRNISPAYRSLYSNGFTENTYPNNEKGFYTGISIHSGSSWRIDAYADIVTFGWLKYRVDGASRASDFFIQVNYQPNKTFGIYSRYHCETKALNDNPDLLVMGPVTMIPKKQWRTSADYKISSAIAIASRTEMIWYNSKNCMQEEGWLMYTSIDYKPSGKRYSGSAGIGFFETGGYNSRFYVYENDVPNSYSVPVLYGKGCRYYATVNYKSSAKIQFSLHFAQTRYKDQMQIGSGLDEIMGNHKSEIRVQAIFKP